MRTFGTPALVPLLLTRTFPSLSSFPWLSISVQPHLTCSSGYLLAHISRKTQSGNFEACEPQLLTLLTVSLLGFGLAQ